ncbi:MAG: hypothetical protein OXC18_20720 [Desulfurellaceae bacterium]|nr:hypothetical protein [Desulfurellaceae bacterium]
MRVLFDQGTPVPLRRYPALHAVATVFEKGWSTLQNGELLSTAEYEGFEVLVTTDQNLENRQIAVNRVVAALNSVKPGGYLEVEF